MHAKKVIIGLWRLNILFEKLGKSFFRLQARSGAASWTFSFRFNKYTRFSNSNFYFVVSLSSSQVHKRRFFTTSKTDRHLLRQKVCQRISVMKTNTGVFVVFKTKHESKCHCSGNISVFVFITKILWKTFWRYKWRSVFDVVKRMVPDTPRIVKQS